VEGADDLDSPGGEDSQEGDYQNYDVRCIWMNLQYMNTTWFCDRLTKISHFAQNCFIYSNYSRHYLDLI
jgi:hypothetical protein